MFFLILGTVLGSMHLYVWKRLVKDTTGPGRVRRGLTVALVGLLVLVCAAVLLPRRIGPTEAAWFAWPGYLWFGLVVYLVLALLALEPVRLLARPWVRRTPQQARAGMDRRVFLARAAGAVAGVASAGVVGYGVTTALGRPERLQVPVRLAGLDPELGGYRIAVVSDIHLGPLAGRAHAERLVRMINEAEPDLVAIVGDLVDGTVAELGPAAQPLQDLTSRDGTFFVTGNHEYFADDTAEWLRELDRLGVAPLRNENTVIRRGGGTFTLAGVNDVAGAQHSDPPDFGRALAGRAVDRPTVLLAHQPIQVIEAARHGVGLQLSGHTHGGQMWPFGYAVEQVQPALAGLSRVDGTQLYVTRGAGFWGPPVRVGAPPDITVVILQPG